ncbi:MAG: helix-turn-helix domain-containing protein [Phycisphaerales bacterium]|nr:helix-turn-helix domain-containing protein [Phycisphaerales bacterium]
MTTVTNRESPDRLLLRDREAARLLGVSVRTIYAWRVSENLPHVKIGRTIRYPADALHRWAESRTEGGER